MNENLKSTNRSFSLPSNLPIINRTVIIQEFYENGTPALIRQFSCQELFFDDNNDVAGDENFSGLNSSTLYTSYHTDLPQEVPLLQKSYNNSHFNDSPMEIDSSNNLINEENSADCIDLTNDKSSHCDNFTRKRINPKIKEEIKANCRNITNCRGTESQLIYLKTKKTVSKLKILLYFMVLSLVGFFIYKTYAGNVVSVDQDLQMKNIKHELENNVISQRDPIIIVTKTFEQIDLWRKPMKVLVFIGSSGIGKTFVSNLIKKHFHIELTHEINAAQLRDSAKCDNVISNLKFKNHNLLIVDDLKAKDYPHLYTFLKTLPDNYKILVITIFNIQETTSRKEHKINYDLSTSIRNSFESSDLYFEIAYFDVMDRDEIKLLLNKELIKRNIDVKQHSKIIELVLEDVDIRHNGFKGLHSKLNLILEKL